MVTWETQVWDDDDDDDDVDESTDKTLQSSSSKVEIDIFKYGSWIK